MSKGAGKGKISKDLVAASCAAVLAVYAAGYLRTRDAARKFATQAEERRLAALERSAGRSTVHSAKTDASAPTPQRLPVPDALVASSTAASPTAPLLSVRKPQHDHHSPSPTAPARPSPKIAVHNPATGTAGTAMVAEATPSLPAAPQAVAPVPLPEEIASTTIPVAAAPGPAPIPAARWRDGIFTGVGDSPHGDIEARVVIKNGRIVEAGIATCDTRYPCSVLDHIVHQPVVLQSPLVDYVSHATESSDAYYYGLVDALKQALEEDPGEATVSK